MGDGKKIRFYASIGMYWHESKCVFNFFYFVHICPCVCVHGSSFCMHYCLACVEGWAERSSHGCLCPPWRLPTSAIAFGNHNGGHTHVLIQVSVCRENEVCAINVWTYNRLVLTCVRACVRVHDPTCRLPAA